MATEEKTNKEVAVAAEEKKAVVAASYQDSDDGFENFSSDSVQIPFMKVLQSTSPEIKGSKTLFAGQSYNTGTTSSKDGDVGFAFIPVAMTHEFVVWPSENSDQKAPVGKRAITDPEINRLRGPQKSYKVEFSNGETALETIYYYGIVVEDEDNFYPAIIPFSKSNLASAKALNTLARSQTFKAQNPDGTFALKPRLLWSHKYRLTTKEKSNAKNSWYVWNVSFEGGEAAKARLSEDDILFQAAVQLREQYKAGLVVADESQAHEVSEDGGSSGGGKMNGDDIPF